MRVMLVYRKTEMKIMLAGMRSCWCILLAWLIALSAAMGCSRRPDDVLDKESMARLLVDIHKGESFIDVNPRVFPDDSAKRAFKQSIYAKHGVTSAQVDSSFKWYGYNMEKYMEVYERAIEILDKELLAAQELAGSSSQGLANVNLTFEGDSVDVWQGVRYRRLSPNMPDEFVSFHINSDRYWEKGDVYLLKSKAMDTHRALEYYIAVNYSDGSKEYIHRPMPGNGWHELKFALDSSKTAQQIYGAIHYVPKSGEVAFLDSISLIRTRWGGHNRDGRQGVMLKFPRR